MREDDKIRIQHMIDGSRDVASFIAGRERAELDSDRMLLYAVVRAIEIIGEAASKVTEETRASMPAVPWKALTGMRHRLIHAYFDIDRDVVWKAAVEEVPELLATIRAHVGSGGGKD